MSNKGRNPKKFGWAEGDILSYFHPVTGERISRERWNRIIAQRAKRLRD